MSKTAINRRFSNLVWGEWMDLRNSNGIEFRNFCSAIVWKLFSKFSPEVEKCIIWGSIQVLPNQVSEKSFYTFEDIDLRESYAKLYKNRVKLWELIQFKG